jgi:TolA-binding protein
MKAATYLLALALLAALGALWRTDSALEAERLAHQTTKTERADEARKRAETHGKELVRAQEREIALKAVASRLQQENRDENRRIAALYQRELDGLRNRPEARAGADTGGVPEGAAAGAGCTGAGLARPDAAFLAGYAADAARLQAALDHCEARYNALRD